MEVIARAIYTYVPISAQPKSTALATDLQLWKTLVGPHMWVWGDVHIPSLDLFGKAYNMLQVAFSWGASLWSWPRFGLFRLDCSWLRPLGRAPSRSLYIPLGRIKLRFFQGSFKVLLHSKGLYHFNASMVGWETNGPPTINGSSKKHPSNPFKT